MPNKALYHKKTEKINSLQNSFTDSIGKYNIITIFMDKTLDYIERNFCTNCWMNWIWYRTETDWTVRIYNGYNSEKQKNEDFDQNK